MVLILTIAISTVMESLIEMIELEPVTGSLVTPFDVYLAFTFNRFPQLSACTTQSYQCYLEAYGFYYQDATKTITALGHYIEKNSSHLVVALAGGSDMSLDLEFNNCEEYLTQLDTLYQQEYVNTTDIVL